MDNRSSFPSPLQTAIALLPTSQPTISLLPKPEQSVRRLGGDSNRSRFPTSSKPDRAIPHLPKHRSRLPSPLQNSDRGFLPIPKTPIALLPHTKNRSRYSLTHKTPIELFPTSPKTDRAFPHLFKQRSRFSLTSQPTIFPLFQGRGIPSDRAFSTS